MKFQGHQRAGDSSRACQQQQQLAYGPTGSLAGLPRRRQSRSALTSNAITLKQVSSYGRPLVG
jgi:GH24 family phage-related lysozyme (muramidase)